MTPTHPTNLAACCGNTIRYSEEESGLDYSAYASANAPSSGKSGTGSESLTRHATGESLEKNPRYFPINDSSNRRRAFAVDPYVSTKVRGDTAPTNHQWRCASKQSVDDESPGRISPVTTHRAGPRSSDNPKGDGATLFKTEAVSEAEKKIPGEGSPAESFIGSRRFRDARLEELANRFIGDCYAFEQKLWQRLQDEQRLLQSTATRSRWDRPAGNAVSKLDGAFVPLEDLRCSILNLVKEVEDNCDLIDQFLGGRIIEEKAHLHRPGGARQKEVQPPRAVNRLCEHYHRSCFVRFSCCADYYPCHQCHNSANKCDTIDVKSFHATHVKCAQCHFEQEVNEDSHHCSACKAEFSEYFCAKCKHFTSMRANPFHCDKCGICRVSKERSFHCDGCNICLDKRLEGKHECRPNSRHEICGFCWKDTFSGCQILPCSHKVHKDCVLASIENGRSTACPACSQLPHFGALRKSRREKYSPDE